MPHCWVLTKPGSRESSGRFNRKEAADATNVERFDGKGRVWPCDEWCCNDPLHDEPSTNGAEVKP